MSEHTAPRLGEPANLYRPDAVTAEVAGPRLGEPVRLYSSAAQPFPTPGHAPAAVPAPIPGTEGPHTRPGWLTRARDAVAEPEPAA